MGEYIDKRKLMDDLNHFAPECKAALLIAEKQPTAEVEPVRRGEWLLKHMGHGHYWECSECHTNPCIYVTENTKFCPNCGARMDGGTENG